MLASSVQRSKPAPYPSKARSALVRRTVLVVLVLGALTLLTIAFRSPTSGALHDIQGAGSTVLRPFQVAATRVAAPFRDAYNYVDGLTSAKSQNEKLKAEVKALRAELLGAAADKSKYAAVLALLHFDQGARFPNGYRAINTSVITFPDETFSHQLTIAAGSSSGVTKNAPVVSGSGLVGIVTNVSPNTASVQLLSDPQNAVTARDLRTGVRGIVHTGPGGTLILDQVAKQAVVKPGDEIVTDGTRDPRYPSFYPFGIPIGRVPPGGVNVTDTATFLQVEVQPFADLSSLDAVAVLARTHKHR